MWDNGGMMNGEEKSKKLVIKVGSFGISLTTALTGPQSGSNPRLLCEEPASNTLRYRTSLITPKGLKEIWAASSCRVDQSSTIPNHTVE